MTRSIVWFRRDLRLADNAALAEGVRQGEVIPAFVIDPKLLQSDRVGAKRVAWLAANLRELDRSLRQRGTQLIVRRGEPAVELLKLACETSATQVYFNLDLTPYARKRDQRVALELEAQGVTVENPDDLEDAFARALAADATVVIDVKADKDCVTPVYDFSAAAAAWSYHE